MTYCTLRSSLTAQPPLTIPEIALRLGVHPAYYQNGIKVSELNRLPTDEELCPKGHAYFDAAAESTGPSASVKPGTNPRPHDDLGEGMSDIVAAWKSQNATLTRVDPVNPPPIKEDREHVWRFDGGPHADEEVFLPGQEIPQWVVNFDSIRLKQIAIVPPGGVLRLSGHDELSGQGGDTGEHGSSSIALVASAAVFSAVALASEEPPDHEPSQEAVGYHDFSQEPAAYHEPGHEGPEVYSHMGMDESHGAYQQAENYLSNEQAESQPAEELLNSEAQADGAIVDNIR